MTTRAKTTTSSTNTKLFSAEHRPRTHRSFFQHACREAVRGLKPDRQKYEPAFFTISLANLVSAGIFLVSILTGTYVAIFISGMVTLWLCVTLLWFNFTRTITRKQVYARSEALNRLPVPAVTRKLSQAGLMGETELVPTASLNREDVILVEQGDIIPADGEVIDGVAAVDEQILTGGREPVVRLINNSLNSVSAGTQVRSGQLIIALKTRPGGGLAGRISDLAREKQDTYLPSNFLLNTLTAGSIALTTIVALWLLPANASYSAGLVILSLLAALLAALVPSPTAGLQSLATAAGTDQLIRLHFLPMRDNVLPRLVKTTVVLLDKNEVLIPNSQQAVDFVPAGASHMVPVSDTSQIAHFFDQSNLNDNGFQYSSTSHGTSPPTSVLTDVQVAHTLLPFASPPSDPVHLQLHHGGPEAVESFLRAHGVGVPPNLTTIMKGVINRGGQPLVITQSDAVMGVLHVQRQFRKDLKSRVERLRQLGIQTILVDTDTPPATANLAAAIGADDFLALASEETRQDLVKQLRNAGQKILLAGYQSNDAIALDLVGTGVAPAQSAYPAREAADIVDLGNSPVRILDLLEAGHKWQAIRQALTVLAGTSDLVKFLVIGLLVLGIILPTPYFKSSATVSVVAGIALTGIVFNVVSLVVLTPLAFGWLPFPPINSVCSQRNILVACVVCGLLAPLGGLALSTLLIAGLRGG